MEYMQNSEQIFLFPCLENILQVESFIKNSGLIDDGNQRTAALLISTEIFENIVEHAEIKNNTQISITITRYEKPVIEFSYTSNNFDELIKSFENNQPYFDNTKKRYRGLGLLMVKKLAKNIDCKNDNKNSQIKISL